MESEQIIREWIDAAPPQIKMALRANGFIDASDVIKSLEHDCPVVYTCCGCTEAQHAEMRDGVNCGCRECFIS